MIASGGAEVSEPMLEAKLDPPRVRPGTVTRKSLVDVLVSGTAYPLVVVSAPAGFGKATLLADWAAVDTRRFAWVWLDRDDDEPATLLRSIVRAIDRIHPVDPKLFTDLASPGISVLGRLVPRVIGTIQSAGPFVLVLRDLHAVRDKEARDALDLIVDHVPPDVQVAVTSRQSVWLATPQRRGRGSLLELGPADLAMDVREAAHLVASAGAVVDLDVVEELVRSTGGWPAGLYLSALALRSGTTDLPRDPLRSAHPFVSQYVRDEVLSQLGAPTLRFLRRTAILDVMSGALCDALLQTTGSARRLESMARTNLFVQPIDHRGEWFRYHALFRATLLDDLVHHEPDEVAPLHLRAADWWAANGSVDQAIHHAVAGGEPARAARLVTANIPQAYLAGRLPTVERWLLDLGDGAIARDPALALMAGWIAALAGRPIEAARWSELIDQQPPVAFGDHDEAWFEGCRAMLRGAMCAHGAAAMKRDVELAVSLVPLWDVWGTAGAGLLATALVMHGEDEAAELLFTDAVEAARATGAGVPHARWLGHRALLRMDRGDWLHAARDVEDALHIVATAGLHEYGASAIVYAAAARLAVHRNDGVAASGAQLDAMRLRILTTWTFPPFGVLLRLELADVLLALADTNGAEILLREIDEILHHCPDLGLLNVRVDRLRTRVGTAHTVLSGGPTLTTAELRILPYLQTNLTLQEIGERLYISRNTVNTHVRAICRKLQVSGRSEAVGKAREIGLLADSGTDHTGR